MVVPSSSLAAAGFVVSSGREDLSEMVAASLGSKLVVALRAAAAEAGAAGVVLAEQGAEGVGMVLVLVSLGSRVIFRGIGCVSRSVCIGLFVWV